VNPGTSRACRERCHMSVTEVRKQCNNLSTARPVPGRAVSRAASLVPTPRRRRRSRGRRPTRPRRARRRPTRQPFSPTCRRRTAGSDARPPEVRAETTDATTALADMPTASRAAPRRANAGTAIAPAANQGCGARQPAEDERISGGRLTRLTIAGSVAAATYHYGDDRCPTNAPRATRSTTPRTRGISRTTTGRAPQARRTPPLAPVGLAFLGRTGAATGAPSHSRP
jgi:hypothetical protein